MAEKMTKEEIVADLDLQLKQVQLEQAKAQLQDTQENLQQREMNRAKIRRDQRERAKQLKDVEDLHHRKVLDCPHKKGGTDLEGWHHGTNDKFAIARFQLPNTDYINTCTRCKNQVICPVEPLLISAADLAELELDLYGLKTPAMAGYFLKGREDEKSAYLEARKLYGVAVKTYNQWLRLPTDNVASTACLPGQASGNMDWRRLYRIAVHEALGVPIFQAEKWPLVAGQERAA